MWGLFSRDPASNFPYEIGEAVCIDNDDRTIWKLHKAKKKQNGEDVSVFICDGKENNAYIDVAKSAVKKLKTLRHPCVLTYIDSMESDKLVYLATEPVVPLLTWLKDTHPPTALSWGLLQVTKALSFLNNEGRMTHHNINASSVYVTKAGDWKLASVEYSSQESPDLSPVKVIGSLGIYNPPEVSDPSKARTTTKWAPDMWGLGCLVWELFNGQLDQSMSLRNTSKIPRTLTPIYTRLVGANPSSRPNPRDVVEQLESGFCKNDLVEALLFLEEIQIKDTQEKHKFFGNLSSKLDSFPDYVSKHKVLPALLAAHDFAGVGSVILTPMFKISKLLDEGEYQQLILPCVVKLFSSSDRATRLKLLQQMESLSEYMKPQTLNDQVFSQLATGFLDTNPTIREHTVKSILYLAPKLNYNNLNVEVLKHFARLQAKDDQGGIRTNTTVCLGKIASLLHPDVRQKCLVSAFSRAMRDPFPPARTAGVMALAATQQYYPLHDTAHRILPTLCQLTLDPEKSVREAVFRVIKGFLSKLEKVSEDPTLKEEMERDVKSVVSSAGQQSTWTGWAMGAITSKFYKSSISTSSNQTKATPSPSPTPSTPSTKSSSLGPPSPPTLAKGTSEWGTDEGWGSMDNTPESKRKDEAVSFTNIEEEREGEGWGDDDEEWGSLEDGTGDLLNLNIEENKAPVSSASVPTTPYMNENSDDFFNSLISNQGPSASSAMSRSTSLQSTGSGGSSSLLSTQPPSSGGGWGEWGDNSQGSASSTTAAKTDDAKREREERRLKRQKEIEAKRAQRAGPMKLGAKKL